MPVHYDGTRAQVRALDAFVKLIRASDTVSGLLYGRLNDEHGLTQSQLGVLEMLLHLGPLAQSDIASRLLRSPSNLTTVIENLHRGGLVSRRRSGEDRRRVIIELTTEGREVIERVFPEHLERIVKVMSALSSKEQEELARLSRKLGLSAGQEGCLDG